ncbi:hypothetical protein [Kutzneria chonburiensis]|uniref:Uncharacterized protein n=1 Tax=Kutzneria chonburiensis TaxID=1483604 RepID=A0ABV6MNT5_9PSEU|nr:hypothetical protein [Kutzneria chonburiensis]
MPTPRRTLALLSTIACVAVLGLTIPASGADPSHDPDSWQANSVGGDEENEEVVANPAAVTASCGVERWAVKTGTDADAGKITLQSTSTSTIASLTSLPAPASLPANNRVQPTETTVFRLSATLTQYKLETDSDFHLVLSDGAGHTMIAEIPDPACVGAGSPLASSVQKARSEFTAKYTPTSSFKTANVPVTITGVGFFDFLHGQTGVAPNGIELHSVLDVQFGGGGGGCTAAQLLGNPGFETGSASPWTTSSGVINNSSSEPAHSGSYDAWMDGYGSAHTDTVSQQVAVPSGCTTYTLSYWLHVDTAEPTTTAYDTLTVQVNGSTLATYSNKDAASGYVRHSVDLSAYQGQTVTVTFTGTEDSVKQTSFVLDDTAVTVG